MVLTVNEKLVLRKILKNIVDSVERDGDGYSGSVPVNFGFEELQDVIYALIKLHYE